MHAGNGWNCEDKSKKYEIVSNDSTWRMWGLCTSRHGSRKLENYPHHIDAMLTYKSRHVHRRLAIKIRFTDYCCLRQAIVARIVAQKLIICRSWRDCYYSCRGRQSRCCRKIHACIVLVRWALKAPIRYICCGYKITNLCGTLWKSFIKHFLARFELYFEAQQ